MPSHLDTMTFTKVYEETAVVNRFDEWMAGFVLTVELWMWSSGVGFVQVNASWHTPKHDRQPTHLNLGVLPPKRKSRELLRVGNSGEPGWYMGDFGSSGGAIRFAIDTYDVFKNHLSEWQRKEQGLLDEEAAQGGRE